MKLNQSLRKAHEDFRQWRYESYIGDGTEEAVARGFAQKDAEHFIETLRKYVDVYQRKEFYDRYLHVMYETDDEIAALKSAAEYCDIVSSNIVDSTIDVILNCCTDYYPEEIDYESDIRLTADIALFGRQINGWGLKESPAAVEIYYEI